MSDNNDDSSSITSSSSSSPSDDEDSDLSAIATVYFYTGEGGGEVPEDVVRVRVDPSVTSIPPRAFFSRRKLEEVEFVRDGGLLEEIGPRAFSRCTSLGAIRVPPSVGTIREYAFASCATLARVELSEGLRKIEGHAFFNCSFLGEVNIPATVRDIGTLAFLSAEPVHLVVPDGVECIGDKAFSCCVFPRFRVPSPLATIPTGMFCQCKSMFSLETPEALRRVERCAFWGCRSLRNVAVPPDAAIERTAFRNCTDLMNLFGSEWKVVDVLRDRFSGLPLHRMMFYLSHSPVSSEGFLEAAATATFDRSAGRRRQRLDGGAKSGEGGRAEDPIVGGPRDCLGMTPLHVLACSSERDLDMHRAVVGRYPGDLVAEDRWGATPLLYALWGDAPDDVVDFLLERIRSLHPRHAFDWSGMVETLGRASAPPSAMENLLRARERHCAPLPPGGGAIIEWDEVLDGVARDDEHAASANAFRFLMRRAYSGRAGAIGIREWRDEVTGDMENTLFGRRARLAEIRAKLAWYEREYRALKDATSFLELALWKARMGECEDGAAVADGDARGGGRRPLREECRITSGADTVIEHVLPYLLPRKGLEKSPRLPFFLDDSRR
jgi:hypothetical protein